MTSFMALHATARELARSGDIAGAVAALERGRPSVPLHLGLTYLIEAEILAGAGETELALAPLERALAQGCRFKRGWLTENRALAALAALPAFTDIADQAQRAYDEAAAAARPRLTFAMPDTLPTAFGYPLLLVLHGNNSNAKETAPYWSSMADKGWVVAVPQSGEVGSTPDAYTWNDGERVATELEQHLARLKTATEIDMSRVVLAGFSMGATQAIDLALTKRFTVRGVLPIAAWLPRIDEFRGLIEGGAAKMVRAYVVVGDGDASAQGARDLVGVMQRHGLRATLDERAHLGHDYPDDMDATLTKAIAFLAT